MQYGPKIATNGLVLALDAADKNSYLKYSRINMSSWTISTGSVSGYGQNGSTSENQRILDTNPWGQSSIVWGSYPLGDNGADGGWETDNDFGIDKAKLYRFSVWVRRVSSTTSGTFYLGCQSWDAAQYVRRMSDNVEEANPYWDYRGIGGFTQNVWYLVVGHLYPFNTTYTGKHPDSGIYNAGSAVKVAETGGNSGSGDFKFSSAATYLRQRVYHYYSADTTSRIQFYNPRIDLVDGSEPGIYELVNDSPVIWNDMSGNSRNVTMYNSGNSTYTNGPCGVPSVSTSNGGTFIFDGTDFGKFNTITAGSTITISTWCKTTNSARDNGIISHCNGGPVNLGYSINSSGKMKYLYYTTSWQTATSAASVNDGNWKNLVWAKSGTSMSMYVNGALDSTVTLTGDVSGQLVSVGSLWGPCNSDSYGAGTDSYGSCFDGSISNVLIYNRQLSASEVSRNYNASKIRFGL